MLRLLPQMTSEPPPEYVAFVAQHLEPLRRNAASVVGDERDADLLYPDVLTDVAGRWGWCELLRTRFSRTGAADECLTQAFTRRSGRWRSAQPTDVPVEVWFIDPEPEAVAWQATGSAPRAWSEPPPAGERAQWGQRFQRRRRAVRSNAAVRLAPFLRLPATYQAGPVAEAAIAWWHAYENRRRRKSIAALTAGLVVLLVFAYLSTLVNQ